MSPYSVQLTFVPVHRPAKRHLSWFFSTQIDQVFGYSFNVNGLGGVLTCGTIGLGAGLSHSPKVRNDG